MENLRSVILKLIRLSGSRGTTVSACSKAGETDLAAATAAGPKTNFGTCERLCLRLHSSSGLGMAWGPPGHPYMMPAAEINNISIKQAADLGKRRSVKFAFIKHTSDMRGVFL